MQGEKIKHELHFQANKTPAKHFSRTSASGSCQVSSGEACYRTFLIPVLAGPLLGVTFPQPRQQRGTCAWFQLLLQSDILMKTLLMNPQRPVKWDGGGVGSRLMHPPAAPTLRAMTAFRGTTKSFEMAIFQAAPTKYSSPADFHTSNHELA